MSVHLDFDIDLFFYFFVQIRPSLDYRCFSHHKCIFYNKATRVASRQTSAIAVSRSHCLNWLRNSSHSRNSICVEKEAVISISNFGSPRVRQLGQWTNMQFLLICNFLLAISLFQYLLENKDSFCHKQLKILLISLKQKITENKRLHLRIEPRTSDHWANSAYSISVILNFITLRLRT